MLGFPIRTSSDPSSVDNSPRHIAVSHVLHRLPMPRHPPCALTHLQTTKTKSVSKTKLHNKQQPPPGPPTKKHRSQRDDHRLMLATTIHNSNTTPHHQDGATTQPCCLRTQQCVWQPPPTHNPNRDCEPAAVCCCAPEPHPLQARPIHRIA